MKTLSAMLSGGNRQPDAPREPARPTCRRAVALGAVATAILALAIADGRPKPARAGDQDSAHEKALVPDGSPGPEVAGQRERTLAGLGRRLIALANLVFADLDSGRRMREQMTDSRIRARTAESEYLNAKLAREVAEIAVTEYRLGTAVQERAVAEGELSLARSDVERARRTTAEARQRLARITAAADNSALGLNLKYLYTDHVTAAELMEKKAALELEQAESKMKALVEFTIPKRLKELQSEVMKAKSDELARSATWEFAKAMVENVEKTPRAWSLPEDRKRIIALIDEAIPIEEQIETKLAEARKADHVPPSTAAEIDRLIHELTVLVDRAEFARDVGELSRLRPRIQQAARANRIPSK